MKMNKVAFSIIVVAAVFVCAVATEIPREDQKRRSSGSCGYKVSFTLDTVTGEFSLTGSGEMGTCDYFDKAAVKSVSIEGSISLIKSNAFKGCSNLVSVFINSTAFSLKIDRSAFADCTSLSSITLPGFAEVESQAFDNCRNLEKMFIIGTRVYRNICFYFDWLKTVEVSNTVSWIDDYAFSQCYSITSVVLPEAVEHIGTGAFHFCGNLKTVKLPTGIRSIEPYTFARCSSLTSCIIPNSVTSIGQNAFEECSSLTYVTIPDSLTSIGKDAFRYCHSLKDVIFPNSLTTIDDQAFDECSNLTSLVIPDSVTTIGRFAFSDCSSLTNVSLLGGNVKVDYRAFSGCKNISSLTISGMIDLVDSGFEESSGIKSVTVVGEWVSQSVSRAWVSSRDSLTSLVIGESITSIGSFSFYACTALTSVIIPDLVTYIGDFAFADCVSLTSITIGNSVSTIDAKAFYNCSELSSIVIPESVVFIDTDAFGYCCKLTDITYEGINDPGPESLRVFGNCEGTDRTVKVPDSYSSRYFCSLLVDGALSDGAIIGISIGGFALLVGAVIIIILVCWKMRSHTKPKQLQQTEMEAGTQY